MSGLVLIVDDDIDLRRTLVHIVEEEGFAVAEAQDGRVALEYLSLGASPRPVLILLDLMMPELDGWTLLARLQGDPQLRDIPVVVMSAGGRWARASLKTEHPFLEKPVDIDRLVRVLDEHRTSRSVRPPTRES